MSQYSDKLNLTCLTTLGMDESWSLQSYLETGGYQSWEQILKGELSVDAVIDTVKSLR